MKKDTKAQDNKGFWNRWARRYDKMMSGDRRLYAQIVSRMKKKLDRNMSVLELACGTGLLSVQLAGSVKMLEATDFSEEMIRQAEEKAHSARLHFSVQDATALPYAPETFDAVVISNALHIMPNPKAALSEIRRVLKPDGILIAPTFTAAGSIFGRLKIRIMELSGFKVFHKWDSKGYLDFLRQNGFTVTGSKVFGGILQLTYVEAKGNRQQKDGIKAVTKENIAECVKVITESFQTVADEFGFTVENAPRFTAFATTKERLYWQLEEEKRPMYAFYDHGKMVGYYSLLLQENHACELNNLSVLPAYRHKGIGAKLLSHAFRAAGELGCDKMNIGIVEENKVLRKWYEAFGFIHTGTQKFDFFPFTCGYMEKKL